jgi:hypothetical protein
MSTIRLDDILSVVRVHGETGSYRDPEWTEVIDALGEELDDAVRKAVGERSLTELLDSPTPPR